MPSSDPITIPKVIEIITQLMPSSILDVGAGNGRYGFLFREVLDMNYRNLKKSEWGVVIDAVEIEPDYISPIHNYVYNNVFVTDWLDFAHIDRYDVIFMGDVLEHFAEWETALEKAKSCGDVVIVVAPNWPGSIVQGAWNGYEHEKHEVSLSPADVGGRLVFSNSKCFISVFGNNALIKERDFLL